MAMNRFTTGIALVGLLLAAPTHSADFRGRGAPSTGSELDILAGRMGGFYAPYLPNGDSSSGCSSVCSRPVETGHMDGRNYVSSDARRNANMRSYRADSLTGCGGTGCRGNKAGGR